MIDKETKREIMATVNAAVREAVREMMLSFKEEWVSEDELYAKIQIFNPNVMNGCRDFLPQIQGRYRDRHGEHDTHVAYGLHAIQMMIQNDDLDFTRPDRVVYRKSSKRKKAGKKNGGDKITK